MRGISFKFLLSYLASSALLCGVCFLTVRDTGTLITFLGGSLGSIWLTLNLDNLRRRMKQEERRLREVEMEAHRLELSAEAVLIAAEEFQGIAPSTIKRMARAESRVDRLESVYHDLGYEGSMRLLRFAKKRTKE